MKTKALLLMVTALIMLTLKSQTYQIHSVEPEQLVPGTNVMTIILDKEITEDSVTVYIMVNDKSVLWHYYFNTEVSWVDSTITAIIDISGGTIDEEGVLHINLTNTQEWNDEQLIYDNPIQIGGGIYSFIPEICMVSSDTFNRNMIIWELFMQDFLDSVYVYRETEVAEDFAKIGAVSIKEPPIFMDSEIIQAQNSNRYKISCRDTLGNISLQSIPHKTIHLTMNEGLNNSVNLIWEKYEGFNYQTFHIYRGNTKKGMMEIAEIASNLFTFTDLYPLHCKLYYQVVIENPSPCDIGSEKLLDNDYGTCKSNIVEFDNVSSVQDFNADNIDIFPNPATDYLSVNIHDFILTKVDFKIYDLTGRPILTHTLKGNNEKINVSDLKSGTYILTVKTDDTIYNQTILKK